MNRNKSLQALFATCAVMTVAPAWAAPGPFAFPPQAALGTKLADMDGDSVLRVVLALPLGDQRGAEAYARAVTDRTNPNFGKFLKPSEFAARYGASAADYTALRQWASKNGLRPGDAVSSRTTLSVSGTVAQIERLFATRLARFRTPSGEAAFAPSVPPTLPAALTGRVSAVVGLSSVKRFASLIRRPNGSTPQNAGGTGVLGAYSPSDFRTAYDIPRLSTPGGPTEIAAVFEQGGFTPSDVTTFETHYHLPAIPLTVRPVDRYDGSVNDAGVELEAVLDIDTLVGINPKLRQILCYEQGTDSFQVALLDSLALMAEDDLAQTISISYGNSEVLQGDAALQAEANVLTQLAAQGQAVFASSGDEGFQGQIGLDGYNVLDPASQPGVTGVGGTILFTGPKSVYGVETAWGLLNEELGATGGGVSGFWSIPSYQIYEPNPGVFQSVALANGGSNTLRNVPDVAADASPTSAASVYSAANGGWLAVGGTSLSTPIWAGFYTIMNEANKGIGFGAIGAFNPLAYKLGESGSAFGTFNDIVSGDNGQSDLGIAGFAAGNFFDDVTGWGSMNGADLLFSQYYTIINPGKAPGHVHQVTAKPAATSAVLSWQPGTDTVGYFLMTGPPQTSTIVQESVTQGNSVRITGLKPGTEYTTIILSVNANYTVSTSKSYRTTSP